MNVHGQERFKKNSFFLFIFLTEATVKKNCIYIVPLRTTGGMSRIKKTRCVLVSLCCRKLLVKAIILNQSRCQLAVSMVVFTPLFLKSFNYKCMFKIHSPD